MPVNCLKKNNQSGFVLLTALLAVLVLSVLLGVAMIRSEGALEMSVNKRAALEAFYAAETGVDRALFEFRLDPNWDPGAPGYPAVVNQSVNVVQGDDTTSIGSYSLDVQMGPPDPLFGQTRWVQSTARDSLGMVSRIIVANILVANPAQFLISTPGTLNIQSGSNVTSDLLAKDISFQVFAGIPINVDADVNYINNILPADPLSDPLINITGTLRNVKAVTFPGVDLNRYQTIAANSNPLTAYSSSGDLTVNLQNFGNLDSTPGFNPMLIVADGDITIRGDFDYPIAVVAGGNIFIDGDIEPNSSSPYIGTPQIGLFAKKDVLIPDGVVSTGGDLDILEAFVIADGEGASNGEFKAISSTPLGNLNFSGAISVKGDDPMQTAVGMNAFATRNYTSSSHDNIPFSPYIANTLLWMETLPADIFPPPPPAN